MIGPRGRLRLGVVLLAGLGARAAAGQAPAVFESEVRTLTFANGMRAVIVRTPPVTAREPRAFVGLYLRYGTLAAGRPELAHLVEHVAANSGPTVVDYAIPPGVRFFGSNAMTRPTYMSLWNTVPPDAAPIFLRRRANTVAGVRQDSAIFVREVGRVAGETERAIDRIARTGLEASDVLPSAFGAGGVSPAARLDSLRGYDRAVVFEQIGRFFRPDNAIVVVAGDVDPEQTSRELRRFIAAYPSRPGPTPEDDATLPPYPAPLIVSDPVVDRPRIGIGFAAPPRTSPDFVTFLVLDQLLMGGRALATDTSSVRRSIDSPLGRRLAAAVGADALDDAGDYDSGPPLLASRAPAFVAAYVHAARPMPPDSLIPRVRTAVDAALTADLTDDAVAAARRGLVQFLGTWLMAPTLLHLADLVAAFEMIDGDATRLRRLPREIEAVTGRRVRALARAYVGSDRVRIAAVIGR